MGDAVKWDEKGKRMDMCLDIGECEKATGETVSVATLLCSSTGFLAPGSPNTKVRTQFEITFQLW